MKPTLIVTLLAIPYGFGMALYGGYLEHKTMQTHWTPTVVETEEESYARNWRSYDLTTQMVEAKGSRYKLNEKDKLFSYKEVASAYSAGWRGRAAWVATADPK